MIIWILKILRLFFSLFDKITFWAVEMIYALFMNIASAGIFSQATIQVFASRIYVFLGLIMVFKVSISLVTYIMNPDNFSKGDVGAPALLKGFIFALVGIVLVPYVFEIAYSAQRIILKENVIGNLILGMGAEENEEFTGDYLEEGGKNMASTILSTFYKPDIEALGLSEECAVNPITSCKDDLEEKFEDEVWDKFQTAFGTEPRDVDEMLDGDILNATWQNDDGDTVFIMDYTFIISTLCGLLVAYILFLFCIDIAVRSVKLSFLQLIAPIPLISKVDPKKGDKVFGNWMKECVSTYLDLFIRLLAIYFALFIISAISNKPVNMVTGEDYTGFTGLLLSVFLIIGALNFARELPKLLGSIFGLDFKGMGGFSLNPMKNKNFAPIGAMAGMASGAVTGAMTGGALGAISGAFGGAGRGLSNMMAGKNWGDIVSAQNSRNMDLALAHAQGANGPGVRRQMMSNMFGMPSDAQIQAVEGAELARMEESIKQREAALEASEAPGKEEMARNKAVIDAHDAVESRARKKVAESSEYARGAASVQALKDAAASMERGTRMEFTKDADGNLVGVQTSFSETQAEFEARQADAIKVAADAEASFNNWANNTAVNEYIDSDGASFSSYDGSSTFSTGKTDSTLQASKEARDTIASSNGFDFTGRSAKEVSDTTGNLKTRNTRIQASFSANNSEREAIARDKQSLATSKRNLESNKRTSEAHARQANGGWTGPGGMGGKR